MTGFESQITCLLSLTFTCFSSFTFTKSTISLLNQEKNINEYEATEIMRNIFIFPIILTLCVWSTIRVWISCLFDKQHLFIKSDSSSKFKNEKIGPVISCRHTVYTAKKTFTIHERKTSRICLVNKNVYAEIKMEYFASEVVSFWKMSIEIQINTAGPLTIWNS